jgi:hypothetical protein
MRREFRRDILDEMEYQKKRKEDLEAEKARRGQKWLDGDKADPDDPVYTCMYLYVCVCLLCVYTNACLTWRQRKLVVDKNGWMEIRQIQMIRYIHVCVCMYRCAYVMCICVYINVCKTWKQRKLVVIEE